jgi:phage tail protein X
MKSLSFLLSIAIMAISPVAFAQADAQKNAAQPEHKHGASAATQQSETPKSADKPAPTEAQKSFTQLKDLAGTWQGPVTIEPEQPGMKNGEIGQISLRVTSRGNALVHEMKDPTKPEDPTKYDHPVTMFYLDSDRLTLVHYCDAGNRPRMVARSSGGKTVEFDFVDVSGSTKYGHMQHAVFTVIDANHHIEDWTYLMPGDKPVHAHMDLQRVQTPQISQVR